MQAIWTKSGSQEITIMECMEQEGQISYRESLYTPDDDELCLGIIQRHHHTGQARHPGRAKTFDHRDREYHWKAMRNDVDRYVPKCHNCKRSRIPWHSTCGVLQPLPVPDEPWEDISMDLVVGSPECEGFDAIWVVVDRLSKMRHFIPCHLTIDALSLAKLFLREVVCLHGLPLRIISDWGPQFASTCVDRCAVD